MARERQLTRGMDFEAVAAVDLSSYYFAGFFFRPGREKVIFAQRVKEKSKFRVM